MDLNKLCAQTPASDGYTPHPLGRFDARITKVTQSFNAKMQKLTWSLSFVTDKGNPPDFLIWGFSDSELIKMDYDAELRQKAAKNIALIKNIVQGVLNPPRGAIDFVDWEALVNMIAQLKGNMCSIDVRKDTNNEKYLRTFVNGAPDKQSVPTKYENDPIQQDQVMMPPPQPQFNDPHQFQNYQTFPTSTNQDVPY